MNAMLPHHDVKIQAPYFNVGGGAQLHRYLVPEFTPQFLQQLSTRQLDNSENLEWQTTDRFSRHDDNLVLRLPIHKTFYIVSCELVCNRLGMPAVDPQRITSAGYVIRRISNGKEYSWMISNDEATGWEETSTGLRDPDEHRRICRFGVLHPREDVPTYSGEQTHPMHPQTAHDADGKRRTVLYGFVSLGGQYIPRRNKGQAPFDPQSLAEFETATKQHLPWPYGERPPLNKSWYLRYTRPVTRGIASLEFFELIRLLVNRYHLGESGIEDNKNLEELVKSIHFYNVDDTVSAQMRTQFDDDTKDVFRRYRKYSLWYWFNNNFKRDENQIIDWLTKQEQAIETAIKANKSPDQADFTHMPQGDGTGTTRYSLFITRSDAREFRSLLKQRVLDNATSLANEMPAQKFQQDKEDVYQIVPFVRVRDDYGKERIFWSDASVRSEFFRVASPFDPNASRPSVIAMPSLKDLRTGLAKGVGMITPPDTFSLLNALNLKKGASEDVLPEGETNQLGIQWICSFSLPVITLVAMILLMIMISLLNIIFFWLPWIKICLPFPKIK